jgi:hypothetical protein
MKILDSLRHRGSAAAADGGPGDDQLPIARYDHLRPHQVAEQLHLLSQTDLAAIEGHERSHQNRPEVLDKLRYLRGNEPLPDYDALDAEQIATALQSADLETLTRVREYELKFHRRDQVMEELARVRRERPATGRT